MHINTFCLFFSIRAVLLFERLRVDEPTTFLEGKDVYADVIVKIKDEVLYDIATKKISLEEAIDQNLFKVLGDKEIWNLQLKALKKIFPNEHFQLITPPPTPDADSEVFDDWVDYGSLPKMNLDDVPEEFKMLTDHFTGLRDKYNAAKWVVK